MNHDALRNEVARVEAAKRLQPDRPVFVDTPHDEPDLVHMGGEHDPGLAAAFASDDVAERVDVDFVDQRPHDSRQ